MTKTIRLGAATIALTAAMGMTTVAHADNADATATAEVLEALTLDLQTGTSLDFGAMVVSGSGTVSLAADGTLDCAATDIVCSGTTGVPTFDVSGTASKAVTVSLPTADIELRHSAYTPTSGGEHVILLNGFESDAADNAAGDPEVTLDASGDGSFSVGGTINLDGSEEAGIFTGLFNVSVEYS